MSTNETDLNGYLPMSAVEFTVLLVLADGPSHGYAIVKDIEARSDGQISLLPGNLYAILQRLNDTGLIEHVAAAGKDTDRRRRYYGITALGRRVAAAEAERMRRMVEAATASDLVGHAR
ncbi:MAG: PadR family transcriptional regulator [Acidobacteriota bacterium]